MKYEAVFGNQDLFDGAGTFTGLDVVTRSIASGNMMHCRLSDLTQQSLREYPVIAMRRIIAEPKRWTVEDQKAGRLPDVGSLIMEVESQYGFEFVGVCAGSKRFAVKDVLDGLIYFYNKDVISPIETPEEKAERLRSEWINDAINAVQKTDNTGGYEAIYDALLSGELSVPTKGGE